MGQVDNLNHKSIKVNVEDKIEVTMTDAVMISEVIRTNIDQIVKTGDSIGKTEAGRGMHKIIREEILEVM